MKAGSPRRSSRSAPEGASARLRLRPAAGVPTLGRATAAAKTAARHYIAERTARGRPPQIQPRRSQDAGLSEAKLKSALLVRPHKASLRRSPAMGGRSSRRPGLSESRIQLRCMRRLAGGRRRVSAAVRLADGTRRVGGRAAGRRAGCGRRLRPPHPAPHGCPAHTRRSCPGGCNRRSALRIAGDSRLRSRAGPAYRRVVLSSAGAGVPNTCRLRPAPAHVPDDEAVGRRAAAEPSFAEPELGRHRPAPAGRGSVRRLAPMVRASVAGRHLATC